MTQERSQKALLRKWLSRGSTLAWWSAGVLGILTLIIGVAWFAMGYMRIFGDGYQIERPAIYTSLRYVLWETPEALQASFNELTANEDSTLSPDGNMIIVTRRFDTGNKELFMALKSDGEWSRLQPMTSLNSEFNEGGASFSQDAKTLYFHSDRAGSMDIYAARYDGGLWSSPTRLPDTINTNAKEEFPSVASDGTLYFSSNRPDAPDLSDSTPDFDLYKATLNENGAYELPQLLAAISTPFNETQASVTARGDLLYFSSDRPGGIGGYDIYLARSRPDAPVSIENVDTPVNTVRDEVAPAVSADGFELHFASNRFTGGLNHYQHFGTKSREVVMQIDFSVLRNLFLIALLLALCALATHYLLKILLAEGTLKLVPKCLLASLFLHLILLALSGTWFLSTKLEEKMSERQDSMVVNLNNLARESIALAVRESVASLPKLKSAPATERSTQATLPKSEAPVAQEAVPLALEVVMEQTVQARAETEAFAKNTSEITPMEKNRPAKPLEMGMTKLAMEMPEGVTQEGSDQEQTPLAPDPRPERIRPLNTKSLASAAPSNDSLPKMQSATTGITDDLLASSRNMNDLTRLDPDSQRGQRDNRDIVEETLFHPSGPSQRSLSHVGTILLDSKMKMEAHQREQVEEAPQLGSLTRDAVFASRYSFGIKSGDGKSFQPLVLLQVNDMDAPMSFEALNFANFLAEIERLRRVGRLLANGMPSLELTADAELEVPESMLTN